MEKKYINETRYKKGTTRKRRDATTVKNNLKPKSKSKVEPKEKSKKIVKKARKQNSTTNIVICIVLLVAIAIISRAILKDENEPFIVLPFMSNSNDEVINIGIVENNSLLDTNINNLVLNEINKYSKDMLLETNDDYSITYKSISSVDKISNKEYNVIRNKKSKITIHEIKNTIEEYKKDKNTIYYNKLVNVESVDVIDENRLCIKLKSDDPYFIYNLDLPMKTNKDITNYVLSENSNENKLIYNRNKDAEKSLPLKITVTRYKDIYTVAEAYKKNEINMFVTNFENVQTILGKCEYNIISFRNGNNVFLFGNPKSSLFSKQEIRKAIAYGIDRESIIKEVAGAKGIKIDLPYIYDLVKYRYDIYAAENLLLTNGYKKVNKVYTKNEKSVKTRLELDLLVNKDDKVKINIANIIKNNLSAMGIQINIEKLDSSKIQSRVSNSSYDLLLANVNLNNNPDINFLKNNLLLTNKATEIMRNINDSEDVQLKDKISLLSYELSESISTIGIYSDVSYLIYSKDIIGINKVSYMRLFKNLFS